MRIGDKVIYGFQVCEIVDIKPQIIGKIKRDYYVLSPIFDAKNTFYIPIDNEKLVAKMRKVLSKKEILDLIKSIPKSEDLWIEDDSDRTEKYKAIIEKGEREELVKVVKTLFERRETLKVQGRKLHTADENLLARAEKMLHEEFALVLGIGKDEVVPFILGQISLP
jgi:CarD family transcriptional regulator